jgi:hypothetical protein
MNRLHIRQKQVGPQKMRTMIERKQMEPTICFLLLSLFFIGSFTTNGRDNEENMHQNSQFTSN